MRRFARAMMAQALATRGDVRMLANVQIEPTRS